MKEQNESYYAFHALKWAVGFIALVIAIVALFFPRKDHDDSGHSSGGVGEHTHAQDPALTALLSTQGNALVGVSGNTLTPVKGSYYHGRYLLNESSYLNPTQLTVGEKYPIPEPNSAANIISDGFTHVSFSEIIHTGQPQLYSISSTVFVFGSDVTMHGRLTVEVDNVVIGQQTFQNAVPAMHNTGMSVSVLCTYNLPTNGKIKIYIEALDNTGTYLVADAALQVLPTGVVI